MEIEQLGPYRIGAKLGKGGMGSVYEAVDPATGRRVAVKALAPQLAAAEGFRERFEAEIDSLQKLAHEGIVRLYGYGEDQGVLFYSMELVDGPSLEQELNAGRRFDWNETLSIAIQVCRALKHAHDHGVIHRDIKPANLLLAPGDRVKIADFGIARLFGGNQLTNAGGILGTADYMSPEQVDGRPVTDHCDQYALGCVMFALLAGRPPFRAKSMPEMLQLQRYAEPEPVRRYAPQTPEQLDRLIQQLLSKDPAARFPNVLVLARHMEAMQKALSRPPRPPEGAPVAPLPDDIHATSAPATDVTLAAESIDIIPLETADSGVYNAPTLADDGQQVASPAAPPAAPPRPTSRFTVVDEQARRAEQLRSERRALAWQLLALAGALAALAYGGWRLTRPATADDLAVRIQTAVEDNDGDPTSVENQIDEFLNRFADDPRAGDMAALADEVRLRRLERQLRTKARLTRRRTVHPAEQVYAAAVSLLEVDPARSAAMLDDLLALYADSQEGDDAAPYLELARRQRAKAGDLLEQRQAEQLPQLQERLAAAAALRESDPRSAARIYQALVNLYGDEAWADPVVARARELLQTLGAAEPSRSD